MCMSPLAPLLFGFLPFFWLVIHLTLDCWCTVQSWVLSIYYAEEAQQNFLLRIWVSNWQASKELLHSKTVSNRHKTNFTLKQSLILLSWTSSVIGLFPQISNCPIWFYSMGQGFITQIFWKSMVQSHSSLVAICFKMSNAFSDAEGHATGRNYMNEGMFCCGRIYNLMT